MAEGLFFFSDSTFSTFLTFFGVEDVDGPSLKRLFGVFVFDKTAFEGVLTVADKFSLDFLKLNESDFECGVLVYGENVFDVFLYSAWKDVFEKKKIKFF